MKFDFPVNIRNGRISDPFRKYRNELNRFVSDYSCGLDKINISQMLNDDLILKYVQVSKDNKAYLNFDYYDEYDSTEDLIIGTIYDQALTELKKEMYKRNIVLDKMKIVLPVIIDGERKEITIEGEHEVIDLE